MIFVLVTLLLSIIIRVWIVNEHYFLLNFSNQISIIVKITKIKNVLTILKNPINIKIYISINYFLNFLNH